MREPVRFSVLVAILGMALALSACESASLSQENAVPADKKQEIVFIPSPGPAVEGDIAALLQNGGQGSQGSVQAVRSYRAASGKDCTLLAINGDQDWIACKHDGQWRVISSFVAPDAVFGVTP